jgi:hypothetical protein
MSSSSRRRIIESVISLRRSRDANARIDVRLSRHAALSDRRKQESHWILVRQLF